MRLRDLPGCNPACRACHYKDLPYPEQLARKQRWADEQLGAWAPVMQPLRAAPEAERLEYRAKSWLRSQFTPESGGEVSFGMLRAVQVNGAWAEEFISWDTCPLHVRAIQEMTAKLKVALGTYAPRFAEEALFGVWLASPHVVIVAKDLPSSAESAALAWATIPSAPFNRVWFHRTRQVGRRIFQDRDFQLLAGPPLAPDDHPILAFRQVARTLLEEARTQAVAHLLASEPSFVVDLYCGTGELARRLPSSVGWLGIELSSDAVAYANRLRNPAVSWHEAFVGKVEHRLRDPHVAARITAPEQGPYSLYLNPPRTGLGEETQACVLALIARKAPARIAYLSCSASSLARDLRALEGAGYRVTALRSYDFFPQTEHFETLAILVREDHENSN